LDKNEAPSSSGAGDFIRARIHGDIAQKKHSESPGGERGDRGIVTRFPPEPNGFLHIGHAKSICLNFGLAREFGGRCHLRFDDTNPAKEEQIYIDSIMNDIKWLGFDWGAHLYYASDYFEKLYEYAVTLIKMGKAYVCGLSPDEMKKYRGTLTEPGIESPSRSRSIDENLRLFEHMRQGKFKDGEYVLRAKIDMTSPNINMRDPAIYRIKHIPHLRSGHSWCIYPMYDFTHCLSDAIEGITHSICTLEFEDHRPLYDWVLDTLNTACHPQQIEFARLNINYTVMSKRKLLELVQAGHVSGWDDPRMPTIAGLKRRGYTPESIRDFCDRIGVAKANSTVDYALLEHCVREHLNKTALRRMAVLDPLRVVVTNYPEGVEEEFAVPNNPEDPSAGTRMVPFNREIFIERDDFMENPPKKYFRLCPGGEIRLASAYYIRCTEVIKDNTTGVIQEIRCTYDPETKGGWSKDGRKVKGTSHWVSAPHAVPAQVKLYDRLFICPDPDTAGNATEKTYLDFINPSSLLVNDTAQLEPSLAHIPAGTRVQFMRQGYFIADTEKTSDGRQVFIKTVGLKEGWVNTAVK